MDLPLHKFLRKLRRVCGREGPAGLTDAQLLERFVQGRDEAAFEVLVWRHGALVLGVCRRVLPDPADVEDVFQATFLTLVRKAGSIRRSERLSGKFSGHKLHKEEILGPDEAGECAWPPSHPGSPIRPT